MQVSDLDDGFARRSDLVAAALGAIGVGATADDAVILVASSPGSEHWDLWVAAEIGVVFMSHDQGKGDGGALSRVNVSEVAGWEDVGPIAVTVETAREDGTKLRTRLRLTLRGQDVARLEADDDIGLFAFAQACLRWKAWHSGSTRSGTRPADATR